MLPPELQKHPLISQLEHEMRNVNIQDVNDCTIKNTTNHVHFLKELGIKAHLNHIGLMHLVESVECHDDCYFVGQNIRAKVLCLVLDYKFNKRYANSPSFPQFYTKKDGFVNLRKWDMFWFNAKQDHALLNNGKLKLATFWFNK